MGGVGGGGGGGGGGRGVISQYQLPNLFGAEFWESSIYYYPSAVEF